MSHNIEIKEGAFIISDAHYSNKRVELLRFMKEIHSKKLIPTQLILMGDIFDALFGGIKETYKINQEMIELINDISKNMEVIYLEGNHDFNLQVIFPLVKVFPIETQPLLCNFNDKKVYLAHGDFSESLSYRVYIYLIRNSFILSFLEKVDILGNHFILNKLDNYLAKKNDCKEFIGFESYINNRLSNKFDCDFFIEGHFHQNSMLKLTSFNYINLAAFACNQRYFIVKSNKDNELLQEIKFSKEI